MASDPANRKLLPKCPVCRKPVERALAPHWPFCSERCQLIDLGKWLGEEYCVPDRPVEPDDQDEG